ncbi:MAG TPA: sigma-70 family RNA polymerase sigma factor [Vicinamibacterales bacterium]|nr:sigma-70 family RNA polymerase sigma factor [Vicinamibacterales bacterium]
MAENGWLAEQFERERGHLRGVAYRILGSLPEAEDAVQETWLRLTRVGGDGLDNLPAWLRTVVSRVCLDMLRARKARREEALDASPATRLPSTNGDPEREAELAGSVGLALLVVLDTLGPAERLAFVLHDMFGVSFDEIARIVGRTPDAARQLASRARRRVQGSAPPDRNSARQRELVDAFLAAARRGDFEALLSILDPDVVLHTDPAAALAAGAPTELRGAANVAKRAMKGGARAAQPILINGEAGVVVAPRGRLMMVLAFTIDGGRITAIEAIADPDRLSGLELAVIS